MSNKLKCSCGGDLLINFSDYKQKLIYNVGCVKCKGVAGPLKLGAEGTIAVTNELERRIKGE